MQIPIESDEHKPLALYDAGCRALAEAVAVNEVMAIRDEAAQLAAAARVANNRQAEADAVVLRMWATRRLGQLMQAQKESVGLASGGEHGGRRRIDGSRENPSLPRPTLAMQGIGKRLAHEARVLSTLSDEAFESKVADVRDKIARAARNAVREVELEQEREVYRARTYQGGAISDLQALSASGYKAGSILVDVPSKFEVYSGKGKQRSAERYCDAMTVDELKAVGPLIGALAAEDCALHFWTSGALDKQAKEIIQAWGFEYTTWGFVWIKTTPGADAITLDGKGLHWGMGHNSRANAEVALLAKRGSPMRLNNDVHQVVIAPVGEHSEKPEEVARRIERLYHGPHLELFARKPRDGWTTWGNEIPPPAPLSSDDGLDIPEFRDGGPHD
jgi:N6-adenosine-specific RNA methylase IME4